MIKFHKEGHSIILIALAVYLLFSGMAALLLLFLPLVIILFIETLIMILILRFFRFPQRLFKHNENAIIAPADGTIVNIEEVYESEYFKDKRILVSIFMSIHNVHINWYPISGEITYFEYHPGKYLIARLPKSSELNERTTTVISNGKQEIMVRQIAGYVARRIICYSKPGKMVKQSEELGFIKFGSRLDVFLPPDAKVLLVNRAKTIGGVSLIATYS
jgi:phosphatidylserine decarboxylase